MKLITDVTQLYTSAMAAVTVTVTKIRLMSTIQQEHISDNNSPSYDLTAV